LPNNDEDTLNTHANTESKNIEGITDSFSAIPESAFGALSAT
jgi:hypothetical protein